jgi:hypothetical protein
LLINTIVKQPPGFGCPPGLIGAREAVTTTGLIDPVSDVITS